MHSLQVQAVWLASTLAGPLLAGGGTFTSVAPRQGEIGGRPFGTAAVQTGATEPGQGAAQGGAARLKGPLTHATGQHWEFGNIIVCRDEKCHRSTKRSVKVLHRERLPVMEGPLKPLGVRLSKVVC